MKIVIFNRYNYSKQREDIMNTFLNFVGFALLIVCVFVFGFKGMPTEMAIAVAASGLFLAFANLDKFSEFKGAGFQAKLREAVAEANTTIENLKEVAKPLIETNLHILAKVGRASEGPFEKRHDVYERLAYLQEKIGIDGKELEKVKSTYLNINAWDMVLELSNDIEQAGNEGFSATAQKTLGTQRYEVAPNLDLFSKLVADIQLPPSCQQQYGFLKSYYSKYKL